MLQPKVIWEQIAEVAKAYRDAYVLRSNIFASRFLALERMPWQN